jgi:ubiquinone/menaquinone biosynthesis C-methylase UbiE
MRNYKKSIVQYYGQANLGDNIIGAFERAGRRIETHEDTASFDGFHIRGRDATREFARLAGLREDMKVLDLGCGVGGSARTLAAEFGCSVTGIDLVEEYCQTATMLTKRVGLSHKVAFEHGDMAALPFDDRVFDAVWAEHSIMNVRDKVKLFCGVRRVLRSRGLLGLYEVCAGSVSPPYFPVPWAGDSSISFLTTPERLRHMLNDAGFEELNWRDVTANSLEWFQRLSASKTSRTTNKGPRLGLSLLMGKSAPEKSKNLFRNLEEDRVRVVQGVMRLKA